MKKIVVIIFAILKAGITFSQAHPNNQVSKKAVPSHKRIKLSSKDSEWLFKLNNAVSEHWQSKNLSDTLFITFKEGTYPLNETIHFKFQEKGRETPPIVIRGNKKVVFSGGATLNNKEFNAISDPKTLNRVISKEAQPHILEYDLKKNGINDLGVLECIGFGREAKLAPVQLFYNSERMTLARYPNNVDRAQLKNRTSVMPIKKVIDQGIKPVSLPVNLDTKVILSDQRGQFEYSDERISKWADAKDVWVDGIFSRDWAWSLNKINKIDTVKHSITLEYNEKYELNNNHTFFFACNLLEELDIPGEYYIDREEGKLFFYPPKDFNKQKSSIQLSGTTDDLIHIEGANNIKFENISFELGRKKAVTIDQSDNIRFEGCEFKNFGISALSIKGNNNVISNCLIHSIGSTAIDLDGGNRDSLVKGNNSVIGCEIVDWAYYNRVYTPAIALSGVGNIVMGNKLHDAPHGAITLYGNDHLITKNEIYNILLEFRDFGAIYAFSGKDQLMRGQTIKANYFHDIGQVGGSVFIVYADEGTAGWLVEDNVFYKIGSKGATVAAVFGNTSSYLNVKHNLFLDCVETFRQSFHFSTWGKNRYENFFLKSWKEQYGIDGGAIPAIYTHHYPELKNFMKEDRIYVNTNSFTDNTIGNFSIPLNHKGYFKTASALPNADSLIVSKNNVFVNDTTLPEFLDRWNKASNKRDLKLAIPTALAQYGYFND